jgi:hypothetical protein
MDGNNKIDLKEIGWEGVNLIRLAQDRDKWRAVVNTAMNVFKFRKMWGFFIFNS